MKQSTSPGLMRETGCSGPVHWDDPEGWGVWNYSIDFARGVLFGAVGIGSTPLGVINKTIWVFFVVDGHHAILDDDSFTGKGDNALDDILVVDV